MKNEKTKLVRKHNRLINACYTLSLSEQRLILMAVCNAEGDKTTLSRPMTIFARDFAELYNISMDASYSALESAAAQLFERKFSWANIENGKHVTHTRRWIYGVDYIKDSGSLRIHFSPDVIPYLAELQNQFTYYKIENVVNLKSVYAIRLYELICAWRNVKSMPMISIDELRYKLGVAEDEYTLMYNFKTRVLNFAIKQINEHSDLKVNYRQHKNGRKIVGFSFVFESKNPTVKITQINFDDEFFDKFYMTESQIDFFSDKISQLTSSQKEANPYTVKTQLDFVEYIKKDILINPKKWWPYLLEAGFDKKYLAKKPN